MIYMKQSSYPQLNDKQWIENQLDQGNGTTAMAEVLGCHYTAVTRAIKRFGLQDRNKRTKYPMLNDKEWVEEQLKTKTLRLIAKELGTSSGNVADHAYRLGLAEKSKNKSEAVKAALKKRYPDGRFGDKAGRWKGGKRIINKYIAIYSPDHPDRTSNGFVFEHRLVAEKKIGRRLFADEIVHHINGNKQDNRPENLEVVKRSFHVHHHFTSGDGIQTLLKRIEQLEDYITGLGIDLPAATHEA